MSRSSHLPEPTESELREEEEYIDQIGAVDDIFEQLSKVTLAKEQKEDPILSKVRE